MSLTLDLELYQKSGERRLICGWRLQERNAAKQAQKDKSEGLECDTTRFKSLNQNSLWANAYRRAWNRPELATIEHYHA